MTIWTKKLSCSKILRKKISFINVNTTIKHYNSAIYKSSSTGRKLIGIYAKYINIRSTSQTFHTSKQYSYISFVLQSCLISYLKNSNITIPHIILVLILHFPLSSSMNSSKSLQNAKSNISDTMNISRKQKSNWKNLLV